MKKCFYNINGKKFSKRIDAYREINDHYKGLNQQIVIKEGVAELFNENPELANEVYSKILTNSELSAENLLSLLLKDNLIEKQCS